MEKSIIHLYSEIYLFIYWSASSLSTLFILYKICIIIIITIIIIIIKSSYQMYKMRQPQCTCIFNKK